MEAAKQTNESYIQKALESEELLKVIEFVKAVNYPIDNFMIDKFWATLGKDQLIYINDDVIKWIGFTGSEARIRKQHFMQLLNDKEYLSYSNDEYDKFLMNCDDIQRQVYPPVDRSNGKGRTKHVLLPPDTLRMVIMRVNTPRGDRARNYYIQLEKLMLVYTQYQGAYNKRTLEQEISTLRDTCKEFTRKCAITECETVNNKRIGCVYFCECPALSRVKIGYTYDLSSRLIEIQVTCPDKIKLLRAINTDRPAGLEAEMHSKFANKRIIGEWFSITPDEVMEIEID